MTDETEQDRGVLQVPKEIADEIHQRGIRALRVNTMHAGKLHKQGAEYAISSHLDNALSAWLLTQMGVNGATPREAIECLMEMIIEHLLPAFLQMPPVRAAVLKDIDNFTAQGKDTSILSQINELLVDNEMQPIVVGGTLEEIIEQLQGLLQSQKETKQ